LKPLSKKDLKSQCENWVPRQDDSVLVAIEPENCLCGKENILECICSDVWFTGTVMSGSKGKGYKVFFADLDSEIVVKFVENIDRWILI
jgi:hypothetical protein